MKTEYTAGFEAGKRHERDFIEHFITYHQEHNVSVTAEDLLLEIRGRDKKDMETKLIEARKGEWCDND
jgi:hypothetical protein